MNYTVSIHFYQFKANKYFPLTMKSKLLVHCVEWKGRRRWVWCRGPELQSQMCVLLTFST